MQSLFSSLCRKVNIPQTFKVSLPLSFYFLSQLFLTRMRERIQQGYYGYGGKNHPQLRNSFVIILFRFGAQLYPIQWGFCLLQKRMGVLTIHHPVKKCLILEKAVTQKYRLCWQASPLLVKPGIFEPESEACVSVLKGSCHAYTELEQDQVIPLLDFWTCVFFHSVTEHNYKGL